MVHCGLGELKRVLYLFALGNVSADADKADHSTLGDQVLLGVLVIRKVRRPSGVSTTSSTVSASAGAHHALIDFAQAPGDLGREELRVVSYQLLHRRACRWCGRWRDSP